MLKKFLALITILASTFALGQTTAYHDRGLAVNPFSPAAGATPGAIFIAFGQVRVCGPVTTLGLTVPCPNPATIFDQFGNQLSITGGNFGQLQTDVTGQWTIKCSPGTYQAQIQQVSSNTPSMNYLFSCPTTGVFTGNAIGPGLLALENVQYVDTNLTRTAPGTDVGPELTAACNALPSTGGTVFVASGNYTMATGVGAGVTKRCSYVGTPTTVITYTPTTGAAFTCDSGWHNADPVNQIPYPCLYDIQLIGPGAGFGAIGVEMNGVNAVSNVSLMFLKVYGFGIGVHFGNQTAVSFGDTILFSWIGNCGFGIEFENGNTGPAVERNKVISTIIANNTIGVVFSATADGGDYDFDNDSFDYNQTAMTTNAAASTSLYISIRAPHLEFCGAPIGSACSVAGTNDQNHFAFNAGTILMEDGLLVDQAPSVGPISQIFSANGANTNVAIKNLFAHTAGRTSTYLITYTNGATGFLENVILAGGITNQFQAATSPGPVLQFSPANQQIISNVVGVGSAIQFFNTTPSGTCSVNTLGINGGGGTTGTILYRCVAGTSTWTAVP